MKCFSSAARVTFIVLALLSCAGPVLAGERVPFGGVLEGDVVVTPLDPPFVAVAISGEGNARHLGQFTVSIPHVVNRGNRTAVGSYQFTAANGDSLTADFVGHSSLTDVPGVLYIEEVATITGGTGRFAGATGTFSVERLYDTATGTTIGSFEGTVSSLGAVKH